MARKRMIAPSIWEDPSFNKLGITARLAFVGMISNADDDGYLRGDLGSLKRLIFGFDLTLEDNMWHEELKKYKNLHFYEVGEETYCHLLNWDKHQTQRDDRRMDSIYPKCVICQTSDGQLAAKDKISKGKLSEVKLSKGESATPSEFARKFFSPSSESEVSNFISFAAKVSNADPAFIAAEVKKFISYWTELNKGGTKQKWELEKTFEVERRLNKWLQNAQKWSKESQIKNKGKSVV